MKPLLLASKSAARIQMLRQTGVDFELAPASLDEDALKASLKQQGCDACALASGLAIAKARSVVCDPDRLILGADQTLELEGGTLDKPLDMQDLRRQLLALRGRSHQLHAAAALVHDGRVVWSGIASARLAMRNFSDAFLETYLAQEGAEGLRCVGGYRIEAMGAQLFEALDGDYFTVLGLPLLPLLSALRDLGVMQQ